MVARFRLGIFKLQPDIDSSRLSIGGGLMGVSTIQNLPNTTDQIEKAFYWSSPPKYQKICEILNGMAMEDMLDELWRIKAMGKLDDLVQFIPRATEVR